MRRRFFASLAMFGLAALLLGGGTMAYFTSTALSSTGFQAGTLVIGVDDSAVWSGSIGNLAPGESVARDIIVQNSGTLDLKYRVTAAIPAADDPTLFNGLEVKLEAGASVLYDGLLSGLTGNALVQSPLASGGSETLTFTITLPTTADNTYQGTAANVTFTFQATQPSNAGWSA